MSDQSKIQTLLSAVLAGQYSIVEQNFSALRGVDRPAFVSGTLEILKTTADHAVRDTAAIILSELLTPEAELIIVRLLSDPRTLGYRGTLVGALGEYDYTDHLQLLSGLALHGSVEVQSRALGLLENTGVSRGI